MPRNIDHRVELLIPIRQPAIARHICDDVFGAYLADDAKARIMLANGSYMRKGRQGKTPVNSQERLLRPKGGTPQPVKQARNGKT